MNPYTPSTAIVRYSEECTPVSKDKEGKAEFQKRILSASLHGAEACEISHEIISLNLFKNTINLSKRKISNSTELVRRIPPPLVIPAHHGNMKDFLLAHPSLKAFAFDMAMLYEKAGNKPLADEIRQQTINFVRTSPKSPDLNDKHFLFFPPLSGKFPVGIKRYCLEDASRNELELGHQIDLTRRLEIDVHYPAVQTKQPAYQVHSFTDPLEKERWDRSQPGLPPSLEEKFPIIIFSHGFAVNSNEYQNIVEPLASHGYCVITVNHPSTNAYTFSLGNYQVPQITNLFESDQQEALTNAKDMEFVLNQIKINQDFQTFLGASLNCDSIGVLGHSLGGIAALETCRLMPSVIKAGINMDGGFGYDPHPNIEVTQPFHTIQSNRDLAGKEESEIEQRKVEESYKRDDEAFHAFHQMNSHATSTPILEARHRDFSLFPAYPFIEPNPEFPEIIRKTHEEVLNFFNLYLKKK